MSLNYYQVLKTGANATSDQIHKSYQQLHQLWSSRKMNKKELRLLKEAFVVLSNPNKRKGYNRQLINEMGGNMKKEIDFYLGYKKVLITTLMKNDYELESIKFKTPFVENYIKSEKRNENKINKENITKDTSKKEISEKIKVEQIF